MKIDIVWLFFTAQSTQALEIFAAVSTEISFRISVFLAASSEITNLFTFCPWATAPARAMPKISVCFIHRELQHRRCKNATVCTPRGVRTRACRVDTPVDARLCIHTSPRRDPQGAVAVNLSHQWRKKQGRADQAESVEASKVAEGLPVSPRTKVNGLSE